MRVFDLDAGDVFLDLVAADDDVLRLADVDAGVGSARDLAVFDHHAAAQDRVDSVAAVGFLGAAGPLGADLAEGDLLGAVGLDSVTAGVFHGEVLESDVVLAGDEQSLAAGPLPLVLEAEDGLVGPLAADRHAADVERQGGLEVESALAQLDDIARLRLDQGRLGALGSIRPGLDPGLTLAPNVSRDRRLTLAGCSEQPARSRAPPQRAATEIFTTRTINLPGRSLKCYFHTRTTCWQQMGILSEWHRYNSGSSSWFCGTNRN